MWVGAAAALVVHVTIAITVGVALFALLSHRVVSGAVAATFVFGAAYAGAREHQHRGGARGRGKHAGRGPDGLHRDLPR